VAPAVKKVRPVMGYPNDFQRAMDALEKKGLSASDREMWEILKQRAGAQMTPRQRRIAKIRNEFGHGAEGEDEAPKRKKGEK
jgi:hypothetical protein